VCDHSLRHGRPILVYFARVSDASSTDARRFLERGDRPRILYVIEQAEYSGAELGQLPVMTHDRDPLLACAPGSATEDLARRHGIPTAPLPHRTMRRSHGRAELARGVGRMLASARDLRRVMRAHPERPIVYCLTVRGALVASLAAVGLGRRLMWHVTDFLPPGPLGTAIRAVARATADRIVPHSEALARDFAGRSRHLRERTHTIHSGCQLELSRPASVRPGAPSAVTVGHISPTKRTELALEVTRIVARERDDFELRVVGRAQYRDEDFAYERRLHELVEGDDVLRTHVRFRGHTTDVAAELGEAGLLLHTRPDEPFGIVVIEAMACGLPVVAPRSGGPLESMVEGETGLMYEPGDAEEAARHVLSLVSDAALAARMGAAGRARYDALFSIDAMVGRTEAVLEEMAAGVRG
jgi:glycosyltransferase involved in cell wall biosynthesis